MDAHRPRRAPARSAALLVVLLTLTACGTSRPAAETPDAPTADAHRIDGAGAAEVAAPARALVISGDDGAAILLDLETEERATLADARGDLVSIQSDGRLLYLAHGAGDRTSVDVIDTARWTVPHGDHSHSFRGEPRLLGTLDGGGIPRVAAGAQRAALHFDDEVVTLAHDDLVDGLDAAPRIGAAATGPVVPFAGRLLVPTGGGIQVADDDGTAVPGDAIPCTAPTDVDITRVGAVFSCAEGAVLFTRAVGGVVVGESIPYPAGAAPATQLSGRTDRPDLAGVAADGAWLLDVRQRTWTPLVSEVPLVRAAAVGDDDGRTVAIDAEGRIRVLASDGAVLARTEPLVAASLGDAASRDRVQLIIDGQYAYVSDPVAGVVHELDHRDDLRVARTFTDLDPWFVELVG
ncbi:ABC transporter [Microbacterium sp. SSW1-49]|uniref:ABC transporter n=1 Tax=Microbacterium croceum TaxID=2851645 RepID=A0ABT0FB84_9MICO|nr:ABC transporter [Microbacterium croceum]MCK2035325.1 ABC transporter [Microbacterium croceum]